MSGIAELEFILICSLLITILAYFTEQYHQIEKYKINRLKKMYHENK